MLAVEMITPRSPVSACGSLCVMASAARRIMLKVPIRLMLMVRAKDSSRCAPFLPATFSAGATPAQLISAASWPSACAFCTAARPSASLVTSQRTKAPPISRATASPLSACKSATTTRPPAAASMRAVPSPRPDAPPVTMNALFSICMFSDLLCAWLRNGPARIVERQAGGPSPVFPCMRRGAAATIAARHARDCRRAFRTL